MGDYRAAERPENDRPGTRLSSDRPITSRASDRLGRARLAEIIATEVLDSPRGEGFAIALHGEWGCGKTSLLNMVEEHIGDRAAVVKFNPWLFSQAEELVERFFSEISDQLKGDKRLAAVRSRLTDYGQLVTPLGPIVLGRFGAIATALLGGISKRSERRRGNARDAYIRLEEALREADRPIVVIVDDLDRLTPHEIREVIRLVKAVGDLPNVTYVLAFARARVERALSTEEESGGEYLEKIIQLSHGLPPIPRAVLHELALEALDAALEGYEPEHFDSSSWSRLYQQGIAPMLVTVRDAYRLANAAPAVVTLVGNEVAMQDLLALEALRIFVPDFHACFPQMVETLTQEERIDFRDRSVIQREDSERVAEWLSLVPEAPREHVNELMRVLFPSAAHLFGGSRLAGESRAWRKNRRVAVPEVLRAYLHLAFSESEVATAEVVRIVGSLGREERLAELLQGIPDSQLLHVLDRVRDYRDEFRPEDMETAARVFLKLLDRLPEERGFFQMPPDWALHFVIEAFLTRLPSNEREPAAERLFQVNRSLSHRLRILNWFGAFPEREERRPERELLNEGTTQRLIDELSRSVLDAESRQLAAERELVRLLAMALDRDETIARQAIASKVDGDRFFVRLLQGCVRSGQSTAGDFVHRIVRFDWDALIRLVGEPVARQRIAEIEQSVGQHNFDDEERRAIRLARLEADGQGPQGDQWLRADDPSIID